MMRKMTAMKQQPNVVENDQGDEVRYAFAWKLTGIQISKFICMDRERGEKFL